MFEDLEGMSLMTDEQVDFLFGEGEDPNGDGGKGGEGQDPSNKENPDNDPSKQKPAEEKPEDVDPEHLFDDKDPDNPESVGGQEDKQGKKDDAPSTKSVPPFSSLAKALKEEGVLLDLEDSEIEKVQTGDDFSALIEKTIQAKFDERQRRIDEALNNGVEPSIIHQYEQTIQQLDSITDAQVEDEGAQGENLRRQILYRDYLNRNFSKDKAERMVEQSFKDGTDVTDAKEALESIKETVRSQYQAKLDEAEAEEDAVKKQQADKAKELRKSLMEDKELFGDLEVDKSTRQRALDAILKPVHQDPETGHQYTAIQMYEREHSVDFLKKVGLIYAMTDGFKNLEGLVGKKVKKEVGKGMKALEETLNNTQRKSDGTLDFVSGAKDPESVLGFTLDLS